MYLTPKRVKKQVQRADKLMRILWRLYSPYREHRDCIVEAAYYIMKVVKILEALESKVVTDYKEELDKPLKQKSIPPGYYKKEEEK